MLAPGAHVRNAEETRKLEEGFLGQEQASERRANGNARLTEQRRAKEDCRARYIVPLRKNGERTTGRQDFQNFVVRTTLRGHSRHAAPHMKRGRWAAQRQGSLPGIRRGGQAPALHMTRGQWASPSQGNLPGTIYRAPTESNRIPQANRRARRKVRARVSARGRW